MNAWTIVLTTFILTAGVSLLVASLIQLLCFLIWRFSKPELAEIVSAETPTQNTISNDAEIAVAIASVKAYLMKKK